MNNRSGKRMVEKHGIATGEFEVSFGCATCPQRQSVRIEGAGSVNLNMDPMVPVEIKQAVRVEASSHRTALTIVTMLNQEPCENPCRYEGYVTQHADLLRASSAVLDAALKPPRTEF